MPPDAANGTTALLVIDLLDTFRHPGGDALLAGLRARIGGVTAALEAARVRGWPVVYVNDDRGAWDGDAPALVREAVERGRGGDLVACIAPRPGDRFLMKPGYSGFDHTPLAPLLEELGVTRVVLMGAATEMCVRDTAIDATRRGLEVAVVAGACVSQDEDDERLALRSMERLIGARVVERVEDLAAA